MKFPGVVPILTLAVVAGCDQAPTKAVEYRPELAGTVDHAMCLLGFTGIPLRKLGTGHQMVGVTLNGRAATFILDTGANASVVHAPFAKELGLRSQLGIGVVATGLGGPMNAARARIDDLRIDAVPIRQRHIMTADLSPMIGAFGQLSSGPIHGIIGQDVMREHHAVIDVARSILYLIPDAEAPEPVPAARCRASNAAG